MRQVGQRDVLADRRAEGDRGGVGAAAEFVDQHVAPVSGSITGMLPTG
jgi:hypothetical protein